MVVGVSYEVIDFGFVVREERVNVGLVEETSALGLGKYQIREDDETEVRVKREPRLTMDRLVGRNRTSKS